MSENPSLIVTTSHGLAERANAAISRSQVAFTMWQKEVDKLLVASRVTANKRLRLAQILDRQQHHDRSTAAARCCIAVCKGIGKDSGGTRLVLFHSSQKSGNGSVASSGTFQEGCEVRIWEPWSSVPLRLRDDRSISLLLCNRFYIVPNTI